MTSDPKVDQKPVRLIREYRGTRPGAVIAVTSALAARLVADGVAEMATDADAPRAVPERAVGPAKAVEVRA